MTILKTTTDSAREGTFVSNRIIDTSRDRSTMTTTTTDIFVVATDTARDISKIVTVRASSTGETRTMAAATVGMAVTEAILHTTTTDTTIAGTATMDMMMMGMDVMMDTTTIHTTTFDTAATIHTVGGIDTAT